MLQMIRKVLLIFVISMVFLPIIAGSSIYIRLHDKDVDRIMHSDISKFQSAALDVLIKNKVEYYKALDFMSPNISRSQMAKAQRKINDIFSILFNKLFEYKESLENTSREKSNTQNINQHIANGIYFLKLKKQRYSELNSAIHQYLHREYDKFQPYLQSLQSIPLWEQLEGYHWHKITDLKWTQIKDFNPEELQEITAGRLTDVIKKMESENIQFQANLLNIIAKQRHRYHKDLESLDVSNSQKKEMRLVINKTFDSLKEYLSNNLEQLRKKNNKWSKEENRKNAIVQIRAVRQRYQEMHSEILQLSSHSADLEIHLPGFQVVWKQLRRKPKNSGCEEKFAN